jgi:hypothetical protein
VCEVEVTERGDREMEDILKLYTEHTRDIEPIQKLHAALAPHISADLIPLVVMGLSLLIALIILSILTGKCHSSPDHMYGLGYMIWYSYFASSPSTSPSSIPSHFHLALLIIKT